MDITTILGAVGSAASGGLLGLFGTGIKMWADHKAEEAKRTFELAMRQADREEMQLEHDLHMKQVEAQANRDIAIANQNRLTTESQIAGDVELAELNLRQTSYSNDKATYGGGFVDAIRGLMRPTLTLYFAVLMALIAYQLMQITGQMIGTANAQYLLKEVINAIIFLATTSVTWWFGSRPVKRG
ncbi:hypothetical protein [Thiomicrorhabdus sp. Kp2]|uniref:hypothetical protein n=1 Tax=Thiomicrorhabdus sp. Kp2 TaxID=1123518 RepID=UPI0004144D43|nr:hypothetical protein [Thiomicrorhabdus sp. Kp2]